MKLAVKQTILNKELFSKRVEDILSTGTFFNGPYIRSLEDEFKRHTGAKYAIATPDSLSLVLSYLKEKRQPFGQIIVSSLCTDKTLKRVIDHGFDPVFVDIDQNGCFDLDSLDVRINEKTVAMIVTNAFGGYNDPKNFSKYKDLFIINESFQAFNCFIDGYAGIFGNCEIFSGQPTYMCGSMGGEIVTTNEPKIAEYCYYQSEILSEIQCAAWLCQLENVEEIAAHYYDNFRLYQTNLPDWTSLQLPNVFFSNFSTIPCKVHPAIRGGLVKYLNASGIPFGSYYPIYKIDPYKERYGYIDLPGVKDFCSRLILLPTGLSITQENIIDIIKVFKGYVSE